MMHSLMPQTVSKPTIVSFLYFSIIYYYIVQFFDQYLTLSTKLPTSSNVYGIGEHVTPYLRLQPRTYTLWSFDTPTPELLNLCECMHTKLVHDKETISM